jgi:hypothetical protein
MTPAQPALDAMMEGPLPCPFCGEKPRVMANDDTFVIECETVNCPASPISSGDLVIDAYKATFAWNRRSDALAADVRAQRETIAVLTARVEALTGVLKGSARAADFYERVISSSEDEQIAVGQDHWNWLLRAAKEARATLSGDAPND